MRISNYLVDKMQASKIIHDEDREIYIYGLNNGFLILINFVTALMIAYFVHKMSLFFVLMASFIPLRSSSGGIHCNSKVTCYVLSNLLILFMLKIQAFFCLNVLVVWVLSTFSSIHIYAHSVTNSQARVLSSIQITQLNRRKNKIIVVLNLLIVLMLCLKLFIYATAIMSSILLVSMLIYTETILIKMTT